MGELGLCVFVRVVDMVLVECVCVCVVCDVHNISVLHVRVCDVCARYLCVRACACDWCGSLYVMSMFMCAVCLFR